MPTVSTWSGSKSSSRYRGRRDSGDLKPKRWGQMRTIEAGPREGSHQQRREGRDFTTEDEGCTALRPSSAFPTPPTPAQGREQIALTCGGGRAAGRQAREKPPAAGDAAPPAGPAFRPYPPPYCAARRRLSRGHLRATPEPPTLP